MLMKYIEIRIKLMDIQYSEDYLYSIIPKRAQYLSYEIDCLLKIWLYIGPIKHLTLTKTFASANFSSIH